MEKLKLLDTGSDPFLRPTNATYRLVNEWREHGKIIIAYDFDDTVYDYHKRGSTYPKVVDLLQRCEEFGAYFIVFTSCGEEKYEFIKDYLEKNGIPYNKINEDMPFVSFGGRKVYYNILLDDRAGLLSAFTTLESSLNIMKSERV